MKDSVRDQIVDEARKWVNTPYKHQTRGPRGPEGGCDCVGLLIGVAAALGVVPADYDSNGYAWETDGQQLRVELAKFADEITEVENYADLENYIVPLREGDVLVFEIVGLPQHVGILTKIRYTDEVTEFGIIHASNQIGKVTEHILDNRWRSRIVSVWRLR